LNNAAHWVCAPPRPREAEHLAEALGISPVTAQVLLNRGIDSPTAGRAFLRPRLDDLHEPWTLPGITAAVQRILTAVAQGEDIVIYGDYDVDGISATALLLLCLRQLGASVSYYLPDRQDEGYGLNPGAVALLAGRGTRLIVTVDCGINAVAAVAQARQHRVDVIITDHHEPGPETPPAVAIVNPKLPSSAYPFRELAGAGVAFKLAWALAKSAPTGLRPDRAFEDFLLDALCFAGLGTIADVVPLVGENRILAHFGLAALSRSPRVGLAALRRAACIEGQELTAYDVAFKLAPRLNAAGRLGTADNGVKLLTTADAAWAEEIAQHLDRENSRRRALQDRIVKEARPRAMAEVARHRKAIVLEGTDWHVGVIGIVASRLVEEFARPIVLIACSGEEGHGSARSIEGFHMFEALRRCAEVLSSYGGHARAGGLRLARQAIPRFRELFHATAEAQLREEDLVRRIRCDAEVPLAAITPALWREVQMLEPFGEQNLPPTFAARGLDVVSTVRRVGTAGEHLAFWVRQGDVARRAVAFGRGDAAEMLAAAKHCSLAFRLSANRRFSEEVELMVCDFTVDSE